MNAPPSLLTLVLFCVRSLAHIVGHTCIFRVAYMAFYSVTVSRREFAACAADRQTVTPGELRVTQAHVEEVGRETGHLGARVAALEENRGELKELSPAVAFLEPLTPSVLSL